MKVVYSEIANGIEIKNTVLFTGSWMENLTIKLFFLFF